MPTSEFFVRLGLFAQPGFLDGELCARIRSEAATAEIRTAKVTDGQGKTSVNPDYRSSKRVMLPEATRTLLEGRLSAVMPELESHFKLHLTCNERLQVLKYIEGDFFNPHRDFLAVPEEGMPDRLVSAVVFLNGQCSEPAPDCYGGGSLVFYGLLKSPGAETVGFPLVGEPGLLIAFKSELVHEVKPITHGQRYTLVSWYG